MTYVVTIRTDSSHDLSAGMARCAYSGCRRLARLYVLPGTHLLYASCSGAHPTTWGHISAAQITTIGGKTP